MRAEIEYPVLKDANGEPMVTDLPNGKVKYTTCPNGIEVFSSKDGPTGIPPLAPFAAPTGKRKGDMRNKAAKATAADIDEDVTTDAAEDVTSGDGDDSPPRASRVDPAKTLEAYRWLLSNHRSTLSINDRYTCAIPPPWALMISREPVPVPVLPLTDSFKRPEATLAEVEAWALSHPSSVEAVENKPKWTWPKACPSYNDSLPEGLGEHSTTFMETISYCNPISGDSLNKRQVGRNIGNFGLPEYVPFMKDDCVWILGDGSGEPGWGAPLWLAKMMHDEDASARFFKPKETDIFEVQWWGNFSNGKLTSTMHKQFKPICQGWYAGTKQHPRPRQYHALVAEKKSKCCNSLGKYLSGHGPFTSMIERGSIRLRSCGKQTLTDSGLVTTRVGNNVRQ